MRIKAQAELLNHDGLIGFREANDLPEPAALLRQADAVLCAMLPAGSAHFYADGKPYRVCFDWPGVVSVLECNTGKLIAKSMPGRPAEIGGRETPPGIGASIQPERY